MATTTPIASELSGVVRKVNGKGFLLAGHEGWLNLSKYAEPAPMLPGEGARVCVGLDKAGFVRAVHVEAAPDSSASGTAAVDRDVRIMRQAVLNTATAILASGGRVVELEAVVAAATRLEGWVSR